MSLLTAAVGVANPAAGMALKVLGGIKNFLAKLPPWVFIVAAALLFALWALHGKHAQAGKDAKVIAAWQHKAEDSHHAFLLEKGQFAIEKASLDGARASIELQNKVVAAQGAVLNQMKRDAAANDARNTKIARSTDAQIAALRAAASQHKTPCTLSDEARHELEEK